MGHFGVPFFCPFVDVLVHRIMSFDFASITTPFRMQPGLRRMAPGTRQLTPSCIGGRALREKLAVLSSAADDALLCADDFDPEPAMRALFAHAAAEHPDAWHVDSATAASAPRLGWQVDGTRIVDRDGADPDVGACLSDLPASWRLPALACLAFEEDFAIVDAATGHIPWIAVCLPSSWAPSEKVGRHFTQIHAPVADNAQLLAATEGLLRMATSDQQRVERFVWTITRHPRLHAHPARVDPTPWPPTLDADGIAARAYFRTERQTFIPVPSHRQAVFTIHIDVQPLGYAITTPDQARRVHDALSTMSPAVLGYRGLTEVRERLLAWLSQRL